MKTYQTSNIIETAKTYKSYETAKPTKTTKTTNTVTYWEMIFIQHEIM